jgi:uncharacterized membrane protein YdbT with pleckstrin-like domain
MRKLSDRAIISNSIGTIISTLMFVGFAAFFIFASISDSGSDGSAELSALPIGWIVVALVVAAILAVGYSVLWVRLFGYQLEDKEVKIEKGVISKSYDSIPYSRIQNVGIERSLLERMLGISSLQIHTAGHSGQGSGAEGGIPGVEKDTAEEVREAIMKKARGSEEGGL